MTKTTREFDRRFFLSRGVFTAGAVIVGAGGYQIAGAAKPTKSDKKVRQSAPSTTTTTTTPATTTTTPATTTTTVPQTTTTVAATVPEPSPATTGETIEGLQRWSDPSTWGGAVPPSGTWVSIDKSVLLDVDANVHGLAIQPGGALIFDPDSDRTLTTTANVVVLGVLRMRPAAASRRHTLRFAGVDESAFVGGGMDVLDTDVGLWCLHQGVLDFAGTPKTAWARSAGGVSAGAGSIQLQVDPVGWQVGDELAITPTVNPDTSAHFDAYDFATVTSINGRTIGLSAPTKHAHPEVDVGKGFLVAPEVLNLTRNVSIEGTQTGRAHVWVMPSREQHMSYFGLRWMGPRQVAGSHTRSVLGRYALHFHMGGDATSGSSVVGGVVRDAGSHAFVAHDSHGMTFTSCISHNTFDDAYWYDLGPDTRTAGPDTNRLSFVGCVASKVKVDPAFRGFRLSGFVLGAGSGNRITDCVAVGVQGNSDASGFHWPEGKTVGVWEFKRCVSHNNKVHGIFTWQNTGLHHVEDFVCYHNGGAGISHGAYVTAYRYANGFLHGNRSAGLDLHSNSRSDADSQRFERLHIDGAGRSDHAVRVLRHTLEPGKHSEFAGCDFVGQRREAVAMVYSGDNGVTTRELFDIVECRSSTPLLWLNDKTYAGSLVRVQQAGLAEAATIKGTDGVLRPEWNAVVNPIEPFSARKPGEAAVPFSLLVSAHA